MHLLERRDEDEEEADKHWHAALVLTRDCPNLQMSLVVTVPEEGRRGRGTCIREVIFPPLARL